MSCDEVHPGVVLVFRFGTIIKHHVRAFPQMLLEVRIIYCPDHDRGGAPQPDDLIELSTTEHAVHDALHMPDRSSQGHV
jgi:hypothetical protein